MKLPKFKNPFNQYPKMETAVSLEVKIINPGGDKLIEVLGIPNDRADELIALVRTISIKHKLMTDVFAAISKTVNHPNELVFAVHAYEMIANQYKNPLESLMQMFRDK